MTEQSILSFIHNLTVSQDIIISVGVLVVYMVRVIILKPSKLEVDALTRALLPVVFLLLKKLTVWNKDKSHITPQLINIKKEVHTLRTKLSGKALG